MQSAGNSAQKRSYVYISYRVIAIKKEAIKATMSKICVLGGAQSRDFYGWAEILEDMGR
nr:hypothetical protein [Comamonas testosteroni]